MRFLKSFNALLLALKHQLTTWTTLLENPFQIQSTVLRSKKVGFILWIRAMNIHLTFCMEVEGKKLTGGIVALWLKDFPAADFYSHQLWSLFGAGTRCPPFVWHNSDLSDIRVYISCFSICWVSGAISLFCHSAFTKDIFFCHFWNSQWRIHKYGWLVFLPLTPNTCFFNILMYPWECLKSELCWAGSKKSGLSRMQQKKHHFDSNIISQDLIKVGQLMTEQNKPSTFLRTCFKSAHNFVLQCLKSAKIDHHKAPNQHPVPEESDPHAMSEIGHHPDPALHLAQVIDGCRRPW